MLMWLAAGDSHRALVTEAEQALVREVGLTVRMLEFYDRTLRENTERLSGLFLSQFSEPFSLCRWPQPALPITTPHLLYLGIGEYNDASVMSLLAP